MKDGDKWFEDFVNKTCGYAHYYEERDPALSEYLYDLSRVIKALDKNQKALIKLLLKLQRENKIFERMVKRMYGTMYRELKHISDIWTSEVKE